MAEIKELKGVECKVVGRNEVYKDSFVAHIDREIGITIYEFKNQKESFCWNKEELLEMAERFGCGKKETLEIYYELFDFILKKIKEGSPIAVIGIDFTNGKPKKLILDKFDSICYTGIHCPFSE